MDSEKRIVYLKGDRDTEVRKPDVTLGDILEMECTDRAFLGKLKAKKILRFRKGGRQRTVLSVLRIIACIHECDPGAEIRNLGETDSIVTYEDQKTPSAAWHVTKAAFAAAAAFCGAAFSIMAFNNDVDVTKLFGQISRLVTGEDGGFTVLEISYSVGLSAGILLFFNHFGKKRFTVDPTPMEIQMRLYENDIQTTLVENAAREGRELDVDGSGKADPSGLRRT